MSFPVVVSKTTKLLSIAEAGHATSPIPFEFSCDWIEEVTPSKY